MNRIICISGFILFVATTAKAQLIVNDNQKVAIGTSTAIVTGTGNWV